MSEAIKVVFVDDEPNVLSALKRMLRVKHEEWDMDFASSGVEALKMMEAKNYDVIVSDIRMPEMDGADLLTKVKDIAPTTIRIALSGQVDINEVIRSIGAVHQYISKPCEAEELIDKIEGALHSRTVLTDKNLLQLVTNLDALPVIPEVFREIERELAQEEPSIERVADYIAKDVGFVAKILKLVNSPYFGLPSSVDSVHKAITMLGLETIKALVLSTHMFSMYDENKLPELNIGQLWDHCFRVSNIARLIAECDGQPLNVIAKCRMTGLLHDVGKLILISSFPDQYSALINQMAESGAPVWEAEKEAFGTSHAEIGAYLMGLWGLSGDLVYGIGHHHSSVDANDDVTRIVHVANAIDHQFIVINEGYERERFDPGIIALVGDDTMVRWIDYIKSRWDYWEAAACEDMNVLLEASRKGA